MDGEAEELRRKLRQDGSLLLDVKVIPRARSAAVLDRIPDGALKIKVTAVPEKGKANAEVCALLAEYLGVAARSVEVISGHTSQRKRIRVTL
jgi:uncharacterized protein